MYVCPKYAWCMLELCLIAIRDNRERAEVSQSLQERALFGWMDGQNNNNV